ncbi:MAG: hypothetical protein WDA06_04580 [Phenylobacterium sp.]
MKCIDTRGQLDHIIKDESRKIPQDKLYEICLIGQGNKTCRYIMMGDAGYICIKNSSIQETIDQNVKDKKMTAIADNCFGQKIGQAKK